MQGKAAIIEALNDVLTAELTAINQYYVHFKMCENWGYKGLAAHHRAESVEEMQHADRLIERILFFDGVPNMQRLYPVQVGETVPEQHEVDLALELDAQKRLNAGIELCRTKGDNGTRALFESILQDEEEAIDWAEAQLGMIKNMGLENYLAQQMAG